MDQQRETQGGELGQGLPQHVLGHMRELGNARIDEECLEPANPLNRQGLDLVDRIGGEPSPEGDVHGAHTCGGPALGQE